MCYSILMLLFSHMLSSSSHSYALFCVLSQTIDFQRWYCDQFLQTWKLNHSPLKPIQMRMLLMPLRCAFFFCLFQFMCIWFEMVLQWWLLTHFFRLCHSKEIFRHNNHWAQSVSQWKCALFIRRTNMPYKNHTIIGLSKCDYCLCTTQQEFIYA